MGMGCGLVFSFEFLVFSGGACASGYRVVV